MKKHLLITGIVLIAIIGFAFEHSYGQSAKPYAPYPINIGMELLKKAGKIPYDYTFQNDSVIISGGKGPATTIAIWNWITTEYSMTMEADWAEGVEVNLYGWWNGFENGQFFGLKFVMDKGLENANYYSMNDKGAMIRGDRRCNYMSPEEIEFFDKTVMFVLNHLPAKTETK